MPILRDAQRPQLGGRLRHDVLAVDKHFSGGRFEKSVDVADQRRLAAARKAHDAEDLARAYRYVDVGHAQHAAKPLDDFVTLSRRSRRMACHRLRDRGRRRTSRRLSWRSQAARPAPPDKEERPGQARRAKPSRRGGRLRTIQQDQPGSISRELRAPVSGRTTSRLAGMILDPVLGDLIGRLLVDDDRIRPFAYVVRVETRCAPVRRSTSG